MKRLACLISFIIFLFTGCTDYVENKSVNPSVKDNEIISAVWIYYDELSMKSQHGGTKEDFKNKVNIMFNNCIKMNINTVFVQVRPFCDAFYDSDLFPYSSYITGEQGEKPQYDPLKIMVDQAHALGLSIHAWINPFRVSFSAKTSDLYNENPALKWLKSKENKNNVVVLKSGIYLSPASLDVQQLVIKGVREIAEKYDVDGIHIDDYFYPSTEKAVDKCFYNRYKADGGKLNLQKWRMTNISSLVSGMYSAVKSVDSDCIFSISPQGNIDNNYNQQYADVKLWCSENGYTDWIIPQIYYGFENPSMPFDKACNIWNSLVTNKKIKLIYGIAAYKFTNPSTDEWEKNNILEKQIKYAKKENNYSGIAMFSYSSMIDSEYTEIFGKLSKIIFPETTAQ